MLKRILLPSVLSMAFAGSCFAESSGNTNYYNNPYAESSNDALKNIMNYLTYLGSYMGYPITINPATSTGSSYDVAYTLMYMIARQDKPSVISPIYFFSTFAVQAQAAATSLNALYPTFVPSSLGFNYAINDEQSVFSQSDSEYSSDESWGKGFIAVNPLIDQQGAAYQLDPTSQALQNLFFTPDVSVCQENSSWCNSVISQFQVMDNIAGTPSAGNTSTSSTSSSNSAAVPVSDLVATFNGQKAYFTNLIPQLNANNLLSPLQYDTTSSQGNNQSATSSQTMLKANSQAQQAQNFVRYASGQVLPLNLPSYDTLKQLSANLADTGSSAQTQAKEQWASFVATLGNYASQLSVAYSNLNEMMAKRMPAEIGGDSAPESSPKFSQAMSEYQMATWRLSDSLKQTKWISKLNNASAATVAKEQLALLAEINYQLYLNRQMQERLLLTNSILLLQNAKNVAGNVSLANAPTSASSSTGSSGSGLPGS